MNSFLCLKNQRIIPLLGLIAILAVCCKTSQPVPTTNVIANPLAPVVSDVTIAKTHWHGITLDTLNQGYSIYTDKCGTCHGYKPPQDFGVHEWWVIMHQMGRKANLSQNEDSLVLHYLLTRREAIMTASK